MLRDILTRTLLAGTALATASLAAGSSGNVVIFYADDVGPDLIGLFDAINPYEGTSNPFTDGIYVQTPTMDSVAAEGVTFLNAYSTPTCSAGRASLLTGMRTTSHGVGSTVQLDRVGELAEFGDPGFQYQTLAEVAHTVNAQAAVFGKWHLSLFPLGGDPLLSSNWSGIQNRGHWDEIHCTFSNLNIVPKPAGIPGYYNYYLYSEVNGNPGTVSLETTYATSKQFDDALAYCNSAPEPFVAYVALNACHAPLNELPPAYLVNTPGYLQGTPTLQKNHSAALEAIDTKLGDFLAGMSPGRKANTLFILMGDNGPQGPLIRSLRDDGGMDLGPTYDALIDDPQPRFKHSVYESGIRVPLIVWGDEVVQPGRTSDALVEVVDLFATTADILGARTNLIDGVSFRPVLRNPSVGLSSHFRRTVQTDYYVANGDPDHAADGRQVGFSLLIPGRGRFKIVRKYGLPGPGSSDPWFPSTGLVADELYRLTNSAGAPVDPRELTPLPTDPSSPWRSDYEQVAQALDASLHPIPVSNYCTVNDNSTGGPALISISGSTSLAANDLVLHVSTVPNGAFGTFIYAWYQNDLPFGEGRRCVKDGGMGLFRLPVVGPATGQQLHQALDYTALSASYGAITVGSSWNFQAWFRDPTGGPYGFNLSDAISIHFIP